jgi:ribosome-associated protein
VNLKISPKDISIQCAKIASSKKAEDIVILDIRGLSYVADFFVICTGQSDVQNKAIADELEATLKKKKVFLHHVEGYPEAHWILMDFGVVIVHIFYDEIRKFYGLEELWGDAKIVPWCEDEGLD